jgi:mannose-1-phosphate guanylyltransferase
MQVMMLAAGRSSRLGALGDRIPKPMVPVCGYAPITFGFALLRQAGLFDVIVNLHHLPERVKSTIGDGSAFGVSIRYSYERDLLGTGGCFPLARPMFRSEPLLVLNGKIVADIDLRAVLATHARARTEGAVATMVVRKPFDAETPTPVSVDESGQVIGLRGIRGSTAPKGAVSGRMFVGVHVLESSLLDRLPKSGESDVISDAYLPALMAGQRVATHEMTGYYEEHSTPAQYLQGNMALLRNPALVPFAPGPLVGIDPTAQVDSSAVLVAPYRIGARAIISAGAQVGPDVVVGDGARVDSGVKLQRCVVWPSAIATQSVEGAVITDDGVIRP